MGIYDTDSVKGTVGEDQFSVKEKLQKNSSEDQEPVSVYYQRSDS